jgi:hypothetical protein
MDDCILIDTLSQTLALQVFPNMESNSKISSGLLFVVLMVFGAVLVFIF